MEYKMIKVRKETHQQIKVQAVALGMSIMDYLAKLAEEKKHK